MDVTIALKEKSKCRPLQSRNYEFANDCKTTFFKEGQVIPLPDRIYLHVYRPKLLALLLVTYDL